MRKIQDYYFKKAKKERYPARSVYKLQEAQEKYHFLRPGAVALDLGCQPGGWSLYAAKIAGAGGLVVGADLLAGEPPALPGSASIRWLREDFTKPGFVERVKEIAGLYDAVLSDAAPRTTGNRLADQQQSLALAQQAMLLAEQLLKPGGHFFCKVFEGEDFKEFYETIRKRFRTAKIVKPKSSRPESREVFVLGMGFQGQEKAASHRGAVESV